MVLDACGSDGWTTDLELVGAAHAELARLAFTLPGRPEPVDELVVSAGPQRHHLLRAVPDPHGDRLVLSVVVSGSRRSAERARRRLRAVPVDALTAGPTVVRRPGVGGWSAPAHEVLGSRPADPIGTPAEVVTTRAGSPPAPRGVFGGAVPTRPDGAGGRGSGPVGPVGGPVRGAAPGRPGPHPGVRRPARPAGPHPARSEPLASGPVPVAGPGGAGQDDGAHTVRAVPGPGRPGPGRGPAAPVGTHHGSGSRHDPPARPAPRPASLFEPVTPAGRWPGPPPSEPARSGPVPPPGSPGGGSPPDRALAGEPV
ncbi:MAG TPA: hypothetical protein VEZ42_06765, partial [Pseudonocardia sp.]|nr:hypothetical protein [Pseudonocardia sp.]